MPSNPDAIDLGPVLLIMLVGGLLALGPLLWVWLRRQPGDRVDLRRRLTLLTLFLTFDLVLFGAFTRLSDSGLGCPDWPGCYGSASPLGAKTEISAAQSAMPSGPVTHTKAWIEMVHRYLATGVGALIVALLLLAWRDRRTPAPTGMVVGWGWPLVTLVWVCIQGAFGALTVTMKLFPAIVTLHLLGGVALLALLAVQAERLARVQRRTMPLVLDQGTRVWLLTACAAVGMQIGLGGWVSTNYAVLACTDFPLCQGTWWPQMRFDQALQVWRPLGFMPDGQAISFAALTAIHMMHRWFALLVVAVVLALVWRLRRYAAVGKQTRLLLLLLVMQLGTGLANVVLGWPLLAAVMHTGGAAALVLVLSWLVAGTCSEAAVRNAALGPLSRASP
jgi:cytochrome c oxidase assembly protein subunit 15